MDSSWIHLGVPFFVGRGQGKLLESELMLSTIECNYPLYIWLNIFSASELQMWRQLEAVGKIEECMVFSWRHNKPKYGN
jgi:hypothetical protein